MDVRDPLVEHAAERWRRPLTAVMVIGYVAAIALALAGELEVAILVFSGASFLGMPVFMAAASRPRAGLAWGGSYAEPWRDEPSPGEPSEIERGRPS